MYFHYFIRVLTTPSDLVSEVAGELAAVRDELDRSRRELRGVRDELQSAARVLTVRNANFDT